MKRKTTPKRVASQTPAAELPAPPAVAKLLAPPPAASVVIASTLIERAAKIFCPEVGEDAPAWARRAAQMVLFSVMPMKLRDATECYPPPLPSAESSHIHEHTAKLLAKYGAKPLASDKVIGAKREEKPPELRDPFWTGFQVFPPVWAITLKRKASEDYRDGFGCGLLSGAMGLLPAEWTKGAYGLLEFQRQEAAQLPTGRAADFFAGQRDGEMKMREMPERAKQMTQRAKIYQAIAKRWKEVEPGRLNSTGELYEWLLSERVAVAGTDSREIRQVCKAIGLQYSNKGGRPKM